MGERGGGRDAGEGQPALAPLEAMFAALDPEPLGELEGALTALLVPLPTPAELHDAELGFLAQLLVAEAQRREPDDMRQLRVPREEYERLRPSSAPEGHVLCERYGSWRKACRAATGLKPDLVYPERPRPWPTPALGRRRQPDYTREEVLEAVRRCAAALGRDPQLLSSSHYYAWIAEQRRRARASGAEPPRLPWERSIRRHFRTWAQLRKALGR